ncbi:hypothetical protein GWI33_022757 [Rhynchophorus ferrugineus]|uniref:Uncharacterized protein n=1 Tax=Rhynchophorus ferrugineus TaxID=354439 RepID=A0A834IU18_RHYFE|nr:hypothetical protein GWI33_022757 [Rhynchophorus ferrugineus]
MKLPYSFIVRWNRGESENEGEEDDQEEAVSSAPRLLLMALFRSQILSAVVTMFFVFLHPLRRQALEKRRTAA